MKKPQLHEHQGGFSDCRIWPIYIVYSVVGLSLISSFGFVGAIVMVVLAYGIFVPAYFYIIKGHLKSSAQTISRARALRPKRSYSTPSISMNSVFVKIHLRKKQSLAKI